ncbi:hypothetical protein BC833DRAFT_586649 [Globomyces pollinis-pini]|nr:hypothetical protein BC833DRAFT_586649 [Globomyces pollinis-pini]
MKLILPGLLSQIILGFVTIHPDFQLEAQSHYFEGSNLSFYLKTRYLSYKRLVNISPTDEDSVNLLDAYQQSYTEYIGVIPQGSSDCPMIWSLQSLTENQSKIRLSIQHGFRYHLDIQNPANLAKGEYSVLLFHAGPESGNDQIPESYYPDSKTCFGKTIHPIAMLNFTVLDVATPITGSGGLALFFKFTTESGIEEDRNTIESNPPSQVNYFSVVLGRYVTFCEGKLPMCSPSPLYPNIIKNGYTIEAWIQLIPYREQYTTVYNGLARWCVITLYSERFNLNIRLCVDARGVLAIHNDLLVNGGEPVIDKTRPKYDQDNGVFNMLDGEKYHVAATYDPVTQSQALYVNGVMVANQGNYPPVPDWKSKLLTFGNVEVGDYFEGTLDEIRVWDYARTSTEILETSSRTLRNDELDSILMYYTFDEIRDTNGNLIEDINGNRIGSRFANIPLMVEDMSGHGFDLIFGNDKVLKTKTVFSPIFVTSQFNLIGASTNMVILDNPPVDINNPLTNLFGQLLPSRSNFNTNKYSIKSICSYGSTATNYGIRIFENSNLIHFKFSIDGQELIPGQTMSISSNSLINQNAFLGNLEVENIDFSGDGYLSFQYQVILNSEQGLLYSPISNINLIVKANRPPSVGSPGGVLLTNGWGTMGFSETAFYKADDINNTKGIGPATVEFWSLNFGAVRDNPGSYFSFGNGETNATWCDHFPNCHGRFQVNGNLDINFFSGDFDRKSIPNSEMIQGQWNHIAVTHGGHSNRVMRVYFNGKLAIEQLDATYHTSDLLGLTVGRWPYYGKNWNSNRGMIDEFRIWSQVRTQDEIQSTMYQNLKGDEQNLLLYYDFDTVVNTDAVLKVDGEIVNGIDLNYINYNSSEYDLMVVDKSVNAFHLRLGGCAPRPKFCDKPSCIPEDRPSYPCYYSPEDGSIVTEIDSDIGNYTLAPKSLVELRARVPLAISSPVQGAYSNVKLLSGDTQTIKLSVRDTDTPLNRIWFFLTTTPVNGVLTFSDGTLATVGVPFKQNTLYYRQSNAKQGGENYDFFTYGATDGIYHNSKPATVHLSILCPAGSFLDGSICRECQPGTYTVSNGFSKQCTLCDIGTYQDMAGSTACKKVPYKSFQDSVGASYFQDCATFNFHSSQCPTPKTLLRPYRIAAYVLEGVCLLILLSCITVLTIYRTKPVFICSSVPMLYGYLVGLTLWLVGIIIYTIPKTQITCSLSIWFISLGFTIAFATLFAKMYRIHRIFNNTKLKLIKLTNGYLYQLISVFVSIEVGLLAVFQGTTYCQPIIDRELMGCVYSGSSIGPILLVLYKIFIVLGGIYISILSSTAPSAFNESVHVSRIITSVVVSLLIGGYIVFFGSNFFSTSFVEFLTILLMVYTVTGSIIFLFQPKILVLIRNPSKLFNLTDEHRSKKSHGFSEKSELSSIKSSIPSEKIQKTQPTENMTEKLTIESQLALIADLQSKLTKARVQLQDLYWSDEIDNQET